MTTRQTVRTILAFAAFTVVLGFAFLVPPGGVSAGEVREADDLAIEEDPEQLPPGWCYSDAIGTYPCHFKVTLPPEFDVEADGQCPEGYVLDRKTGKCINDQLSVPDPVPADPFDCPDGCVDAVSPLNPQLGCISDTIVVEQPGD